MLSALFQRLISPCILYLTLATAIWQARYITPFFFTYGLLGLLGFYLTRAIYYAVSREWTLDSLGKRAWRMTDYSPFGIYTLVRALRDFSRYRNHEFWWKNFLGYGNPRNPYTVEGIVFGERIVFTSDEENIKAVLATQFQDYGKGPQFRKEWKDFLGLSMFFHVVLRSIVSRTYIMDRYLYDGWRYVA